jgi:hypothetical protein
MILQGYEKIDTYHVFIKNYIPNSVKIYINGMRLTRGNSYDFREVGFNIIVFNFFTGAY